VNLTSRIEDRIRKLLRLGQSPNEHEARLAVELAFELAARHQVEIEALQLDDRERRLVLAAVECGLRLPLEKSLALNLVHAFFNVSCVRGRGSVKFVGLPQDIEIARYVWEFLSETARGLVHEQRALLRGRFTENRRRNFIFGFFYGVASRLRGSEALLIPEGSSTALALVDRAAERKDFVAAEIGPTQDLTIALPKRKDPDAMTRGYVLGKAVEIRKAVGAPASAACASLCPARDPEPEGKTTNRHSSALSRAPNQCESVKISGHSSPEAPR